MNYMSSERQCRVFLTSCFSKFSACSGSPKNGNGVPDIADDPPLLGVLDLTTIT